MQIQELFDIDRYVSTNSLGEVKSQHIYKTQNQFNPEGLFSEEIFGQTNEQQKYRCAYIKLPIHIFNPFVGKTIINRSGGIIRKLAYGETKCDLKDGVLIPNKEGKYCGLKDLYEIWEKIDIKKTLSSRNVENINILIKSPKRLLFQDKILVLPTSFRPIGMRNGKTVKNELNSLYTRLIGLKSVTAHTTSSVYQVWNKMQDCAIDIYTYVQEYISAKNGFLQRNLLAKVTAYTARNVISAPSYKSEHPPISVYRTGYPLHTCLTLFTPLVKYQMREFFSYNNMMNVCSNKEDVKPGVIQNIYDNKMIDDLCKIFKENPGARFQRIYLDAEKTVCAKMEYLDVDNNKTVVRDMTLTDVVYLCCIIAIVDADRMCYLVRYPIGHYLGNFFTKVHVLSTQETIHIQFMGRDFKYYPDINLEMTHEQVAIYFTEVINMSNSRLAAIGGDYDGDTVKSIGLWSDEANKRAHELMYSKIYSIRPQCVSTYEIKIECLNGLYGLTKRPDLDKK